MEDGEENEPLLQGNSEEVHYQRSRDIPPNLGDPGMTSPTPGKLAEALGRCDGNKLFQLNTLNIQNLFVWFFSVFLK